ncbi:MAG: RNA methyltransferase [Acidobacteria bacterium]|nr:RNA methyltransferase [Acidobacteriota bacterium]
MSYDSNKEIPGIQHDMVRAETLTSDRNPLLKEIRRAIARGSLMESGLCVAETFHLLEEALGSGCEVKTVLAAQSARAAVEALVAKRAGVRVLALEDALFDKLAATEASQGVMALVRPPAWELEQLFGGTTLLLVLDGIQDPGNAGAMIRAAEAFGATGVLLLKGTVNPYNPKAVRASAGSIFRVPLVWGVDQEPGRAALEQQRLDVYAAMPGAAKTLHEVDLTRNVAFVIGSEGRGVSERLRGAALELRIPTLGVESLNAAMAAGVLLYEARRQRLGVV